MEKILLKKDFFESSDLSLVSALQLHGYQIEAMDRNNPDKVIFVIRRNEGLDNLIQAFWSRSLKVEPLAYFESMKSIKARLYQQ